MQVRFLQRAQMNKKIIILLFIAIIAIVSVYFSFVKKSPVIQVNAPTSQLAVFSNSYVLGYEGDFQSVTYKLYYPKDKFLLRSKVIAPSTVSIKDLATGKISTIKFFYNGAAGFSSVKELWQTQFKSQCSDCIQSENNFSYPSNDIATFSNASDEWIVFSQIPGFVIADLKKPSSDAKQVVQSLAVTETKASMPEFSTIKIYFANEKKSPVISCKEVVAVDRQIIKTPKIATAAIETLFEGPNQQEKDAGYTTAIPAGSELNSLSIENRKAYADFNSITESGGGSCSMAMRVSQIRQTLLQFPTIKEVIFSINGQTDPIFQP